MFTAASFSHVAASAPAGPARGGVRDLRAHLLPARLRGRLDRGVGHPPGGLPRPVRRGDRHGGPGRPLPVRDARAGNAGAPFLRLPFGLPHAAFPRPEHRGVSLRHGVRDDLHVPARVPARRREEIDRRVRVHLRPDGHRDAGAGPPAPRPAAPRADVAGRPAPAGRGKPADPLRRDGGGARRRGRGRRGRPRAPLPRPVGPGARPRRRATPAGWRWRCSPGPSTWGW